MLQIPTVHPPLSTSIRQWLLADENGILSLLEATQGQWQAMKRFRRGKDSNAISTDVGKAIRVLSIWGDTS
jgi:hypothetical protein